MSVEQEVAQEKAEFCCAFLERWLQREQMRRRRGRARRQPAAETSPMKKL